MKNSLLLVVAALFIFSCKKTEQTPNNLPATVTPTAGAIGEVALYNEFGKTLSPEGITVNVPSAGVSAVTNNSGKFELSNILSGTYDVSFSGKGINGYKKLGYSFVPGATSYLGKFELLQKSTLDITLSAAKSDSVTSGIEIYFEGSASSLVTDAETPVDNTYRSIVIFISTGYFVSPSNYTSYAFKGVKLAGTAAPYTATIAEGTNRISIPLKALYESGYKKGDQLYFTAAGSASANFNPYYYDYRTQKKVFYAINTLSKTVSIILP